MKRKRNEDSPETPKEDLIVKMPEKKRRGSSLLDKAFFLSGSLLGFLALLLLLILIIVSLSETAGRDPAPYVETEGTASEKEETDDSEQVGQAPLRQIKSDEETEETAVAKTEADPPETEEATDSDWQETIFGSREATLLQNIRVTGHAAEQKAKTGYRESDFLPVLSEFLEANRLNGITEVTFEEEIPVSADHACAFSAGLAGRKDKVLTVLMYPDYPGRYLLTLQDAREVTVEVQVPQAAAETETIRQESVPAQVQTETEAHEQAPVYDATTLSLKGIPATLLNYLANQYELQYTLYDYLYQNGRRDVTWAEVTGYEIDAEEKTAKISLQLSDSGSLTCIYDRVNNRYSYH